MAQRIKITFIDDLDGTELDGGQALAFSHRGVNYEIDLSEENANKLDSALAPFIGAARRVGGRRTSIAPSSAASDEAKNDRAAVREWAISNGYKIPPRGRISREIQDAHNAAIKAS